MAAWVVAGALALQGCARWAGAPPDPAGGDTALEAEWAPVRDVERQTQTVEPLTVDLWQPYPQFQGPPYPVAVRIWNPSSDRWVRVAGLRLELGVTLKGPPDRDALIWQAALPPLTAWLPPRGGFELVARWPGLDQSGRAAEPGRHYEAALIDTQISYEIDGRSQAQPLGELSHYWFRGIGFTIPYTGEPRQPGTLFGPWEWIGPGGELSVSAKRLDFRPAELTLAGTVVAPAGMDIDATPRAWALTPAGERRLTPTGSGADGGARARAGRIAYTWDLRTVPLPPDTRAVVLRWGTLGGQPAAELRVPVTADGSAPTPADRAALARVEEAIGRVAGAAGVALELADRDRAAADGFLAHQAARAPQVVVRGTAPVAGERQACLVTLARELFSLPGVAAVTLVLPRGEMHLERERFENLKWEVLTAREIDQATGFTD